ncbi:hypothetical protein B0H12DRAFT_1160427 [Mycena haematopus]|nr:hypothetical protein B0H12DRAFT_1160427 [Mycena haematopus]
MSSLDPTCLATFPGVGAGFNGCSSGNTTVLETCCSTVGGTVTSANGTCGCSFNAAFAPSDNQTFVDCSMNNHFVAASFAGPEHIPAISGSFLGCTASVAGALQLCCPQVGGTLAFVNGTCGCPFDSVFTSAVQSRLSWSTCVVKSSFGVDACNIDFKPSSSQAIAALPLNVAVVVLGLSLLGRAIGL